MELTGPPWMLLLLLVPVAVGWCIAGRWFLRWAGILLRWIRSWPSKWRAWARTWLLKDDDNGLAAGDDRRREPDRTH
ncbi:hypothetical protein [Streptomyces sporangiiformans]|uniref:Uncharacterized protein n=1 Tax=Streptomyces sporangiiformans TaxID=2315329 RepID=A0A505DMA2_9ACTN|nr:hypothetical protein [Streptomyces sporangiiformans]TPQ22006.1 hypothetical protein FGD71_012080 [Streptomyces sporangiiformans]